QARDRAAQRGLGHPALPGRRRERSGLHHVHEDGDLVELGCCFHATDSSTLADWCVSRNGLIFGGVTALTNREGTMRHVSTILRYLLGTVFFVFGLNGFLHFLPMPPIEGPAGAFLGALVG